MSVCPYPALDFKPLKLFGPNLHTNLQYFRSKFMCTTNYLEKV